MRCASRRVSLGSLVTAMDHLVNSSTKAHYMSGGNISVLIIFRRPNGTALGVGAQHSQCHAQWYGSVPSLKVMALYSSEDAKGLLKATIQDPNPVVFLENKLFYGRYFPVSDEVLDPSFTLTIGIAKYSNLNNVPVYNQYWSSAATSSSIVIGGGSEGEKMVGIVTVAAAIAAGTIASSGGGKDEQMAKTGMAMVMLHYLLQYSVLKLLRISKLSTSILHQW
ncbi:Pyruvate dehydrogenase E1 component subunit beta-1, mitochondrial [Capsicum baccatum]|uniref:Pyruvate dehydrogenase E1 component subunit beta n=1 Tax=Capsicum baccatum TaxID=33114 RepID=A0A2G2XQS9_CAPBA|nr:Pyruvate dehydrogenase E1 component subunit beta-1, mitochondrial [Capsicum baccatum]